MGGQTEQGWEPGFQDLGSRCSPATDRVCPGRSRVSVALCPGAARTVVLQGLGKHARVEERREEEDSGASHKMAPGECPLGPQPCTRPVSRSRPTSVLLAGAETSPHLSGPPLAPCARQGRWGTLVLQRRALPRQNCLQNLTARRGGCAGVPAAGL